MNVLICLFQIFFIKTSQQDGIQESYNLSDEYNFYCEMDLFKKYLKTNFNKYATEINEVIKTKIYNTNLEKLKSNIIKHEKFFPEYTPTNLVEETSKAINMICEKYNCNAKDRKDYEEILKKNIDDDYNAIYKQLKQNFANAITKNENNIKKTTDVAYILNLVSEKVGNENEEKIKEVTTSSNMLIELYKLESEISRRVTPINIFAKVNPVHELMASNVIRVERYNYIDVLIERLDIYDIPSCLQIFIDDIKTKNHLIKIYNNKTNKICEQLELLLTPPYGKSVKDIDYENKILDLENQLYLQNMNRSDSNNNAFDFENNELLKKLKKEINDIQKIYTNFFFEYKEIERLMKEAIKNHLTNFVKTKKSRFEYIKVFNMCVSNQSLIYETQMQPMLVEFIQKIEDHKINDGLEESLKIKINNNRIFHYNYQLKCDVENFLLQLFYKSNFYYIYDRFTELMTQRGYKLQSDAYNDFLRLEVGSHGFKKIEKILLQVEKQFTDDGIRNDCFSTLLKISQDNCAKLNEISINLEHIYPLNNSDDAKPLKEKMDLCLNNEKELAESLKSLFEKKIVTKQIIKENKVIIAENKKENQVQEKSNKTLIFILASTGIIILIGVVVYLIFKYK